jgi:hypothetical protein
MTLICDGENRGWGQNGVKTAIALHGACLFLRRPCSTLEYRLAMQ